MDKKLENILLRFNQIAKTGFAKSYQEHDPRLSSLAISVNSSSVASIKYLFYQFISGLRLFTGNRIYDSFPDTYQFAVANKTFDKALEILVDTFEEAVKIGNDGKLEGIDPYTATINSLGPLAKDHPFELMVTMIENGTSSTPLSGIGIPDTITCLDTEPLFSLLHDYKDVPGTQENIMTGTGVTTASLKDDLLDALARFATFFYAQNGSANAEKRSLNKMITEFNIHCPVALFGKFVDLKKTEGIVARGDNTVSSFIKDIIPHQFTDVNDYYIELLNKENAFMRPFINQIRKLPIITLASPTDQSVKDNDMLQYGVRAKHMVGAGAWWKMIKVTN